MRFPYPIYGVALPSLAILLGACTPSALTVPPAVPTEVNVAGTPREAWKLLDMDTVRDAASLEGVVAVATDSGALVYGPGTEAKLTRLDVSSGLSSDDVRAVAWLAPHELVVATPDTAFRFRTDGGVLEPFGDPGVGSLRALLSDAGTVWACGARGLSRRTVTSEGWSRFGEATSCAALSGTNDSLWVGTSDGLLHIEGDVVRELGELPASDVVHLTAMSGGRVLAIAHGEGGAMLLHFDGYRIYGYTLTELDEPLVGLAPRGEDVLLLTTERQYVITSSDPPREAVPLAVVYRGERRSSLAYKARVRPVEKTAAQAAAEEMPPKGLPVLADEPPTRQELDGPPLTIRYDGAPSPGAYLVRGQGETLLVAVGGQGVVELPRGRTLSSRNLVVDRNLQLAEGTAGDLWFVSDAGDVGYLLGRRVHRTSFEEGFDAQAIASGPDGAMVIGITDRGQLPVAPPEGSDAAGGEGAPAATESVDEAEARDVRASVRVLRLATDGAHTEILSRSVSLSRPLHSIPFMGVDAQGKVWAGVRLRGDSPEESHMRGAIVLDPSTELVVHHHRDADRAAGGLSMPDDVSAVDLSEPKMAWLASLLGAVRVGNEQAVVFGEARGVRGEVVTDLAVAGGRVWLATAEGLGYYENGTFEFRLPPVAKAFRPTALAAATQDLFAVGSKGVLHHRLGSESFVELSSSADFTARDLVDVSIDGTGRLFFLGEDRITVFEPPRASSDAR